MKAIEKLNVLLRAGCELTLTYDASPNIPFGVSTVIEGDGGERVEKDTCWGKSLPEAISKKYASELEVAQEKLKRLERK